MKVCEIFKSIQGETSYAGIQVLFVRTTGCNLRCRWCDTTYAYNEGEDYSIDEIVRILDKYDCRNVVITGGEPLLQEEAPLLAENLVKNGYKVFVETNGSMDVSQLHPDVIKILDIKCPGSGMADNIMWDNLNFISSNDEIKFIVADNNDYVWAKSVIDSCRLTDICNVLISPVFSSLDPKQLAAWIINDNLGVRLQLQLHKYIWGPDVRGV
ncbi:MAG: radical SAM protein [Nitrospirae bacterium]|nr:radical SAM protein [Nitrospirota bacterium]